MGAEGGMPGGGAHQRQAHYYPRTCRLPPLLSQRQKRRWGMLLRPHPCPPSPLAMSRKQQHLQPPRRSCCRGRGRAPPSRPRRHHRPLSIIYCPQRCLPARGAGAAAPLRSSCGRRGDAGGEGGPACVLSQQSWGVLNGGEFIICETMCSKRDRVSALHSYFCVSALFIAIP